MTRKQKLTLTLSVGTVGSLLWLAAAPKTPDPLDAVVAAPDTHVVALDNDFVRVLDVHVPPGKIEPRHRHPHGMSVYFTDWDVKVTVDGKKPETHQRKAGTFAWSEAIVHTVENVGKTEGHILRIELKF
jgi:quercetin dioxygenase-like cupin family protein